jgi:hypothetical protein
MTTRVAGATLRPGPTNTLVDVPKIRVGHATLVGEGMLTGTHGGAHPARGGDWRRGRAGRRAGHQRDRPPGPQNLVERVHAVILTGGSAYGLGDRGRRDANARGGGAPRAPRARPPPKVPPGFPWTSGEHLGRPSPRSHSARETPGVPGLPQSSGANSSSGSPAERYRSHGSEAYSSHG